MYKYIVNYHKFSDYDYDDYYYYSYNSNNNHYLYYIFDNEQNINDHYRYYMNIKFRIDNLSIQIKSNIENYLKIKNYYESSLNCNKQNNFKLIKSYNLKIEEIKEKINFSKIYNLYYNFTDRNFYIFFNSEYKILSSKTYRTTLNNNITFFISFLTKKNFNNRKIFEQFIKYKIYYKNILYSYHIYDILNIYKYIKINNYEIEDSNIIINFDNFTIHNENDKLILHFLDLIKHSKIKYFCKNTLNNILLFLIDNVNIIKEIYKDL